MSSATNYNSATRAVRRRRKEERPAELCAAALDVFAEKGFAATRLEDIAARAGVSKGTVYLYFASKEALFKAAVQGAMIPALATAESISAESGKPAAELLRELVRGWWRMLGSGAAHGVPRLLLAESESFSELVLCFNDEVIVPACHAMMKVIASGISRGEFRPVDPLLAARLVFSPVFSVFLWRRAFASFPLDLADAEVFLDQACDVLINGLAMRSK